MAQPLISIITPSYNQGRFIEETVQSVLSQNYPHVEYIVMDGGSTDHTLDVLRRYEGKLHWRSEKDEGQADAIQKGFQKAKGTIFAWLNSDDVYLPGTFRKIVDFFNAHPDARMVYGKAKYCDESGTVIGEYPSGPFDHDRLAVFNMICQPSVFFRKETLEEVGGLDLKLQYAMDYDLWIRIGSGGGIYFLPEILSMYRLHETSKTISGLSAFRRNEECLKIVQKYYRWAPLNRVYGYSHYRVLSRFPGPRKWMKLPLWFFTVILTLMEYLRRNRGFRVEDVRMLTASNFFKMIGGWEPGDHLKDKGQRPILKK